MLCELLVSIANVLLTLDSCSQSRPRGLCRCSEPFAMHCSQRVRE